MKRWLNFGTNYIQEILENFKETKEFLGKFGQNFTQILKEHFQEIQEKCF